jgi:hypothetical protein
VRCLTHATYPFPPKIQSIHFCTSSDIRKEEEEQEEGEDEDKEEEIRTIKKGKNHTTCRPCPLSCL